MSPAVRALVLVAALAGLSKVAAWVEPARPVPVQLPSAVGSERWSSRCPPGTLPDGQACIPAPVPELPPAGIGVGARSDLIPKLASRPAAYDHYRLPLEVTGTVEPLADRPGALWLPAASGTAVQSVPLERQVGEAAILFAEAHQEPSVVVLHHVREGSRDRECLLLLGPLDRLELGIRPGAALGAGALLGHVGAAAGGTAGLSLEARWVRRGVVSKELGPGQWRDPAQTVAVDLRNVLVATE